MLPSVASYGDVLRPCRFDGISASIDPEDLRESFQLQKCVAENVRRFGGFVAQYMGDGVLVYFGYPQAHEDDAERAVRAGLELIAAMGGLKSSAPLQTRLGVATGLVVVGDLIGSRVRKRRHHRGDAKHRCTSTKHRLTERRSHRRKHAKRSAIFRA